MIKSITYISICPCYTLLHIDVGNEADREVDKAVKDAEKDCEKDCDKECNGSEDEKGCVDDCEKDDCKSKDILKNGSYSVDTKKIEREVENEGTKCLDRCYGNSGPSQDFKEAVAFKTA